MKAPAPNPSLIIHHGSGDPLNRAALPSGALWFFYEAQITGIPGI